MKKIVSILLTMLTFLLSSCQVIGDIFKAGVLVGILIVVGVIAIIIYFVTKNSNKN
jgi:hypothetical protein